MNLKSVNYVSAVVAAIVGFAFGFLWYSPLLFGDFWMQAMNLQPDSFSGGRMLFNFAAYLILNFVLATVTAVFANALNLRGVNGAISLSLWIGLGLLIVNMLGGYLWLPLGWEIVVIDGVYVFIRAAIFCFFACLWPKKKA